MHSNGEGVEFAVLVAVQSARGPVTATSWSLRMQRAEHVTLLVLTVSGGEIFVIDGNFGETVAADHGAISSPTAAGESYLVRALADASAEASH